MTPILLYHQITDAFDADDPFQLSVTPQSFEAQMYFLAKNGYRCLSLGEALEQRASGQKANKTFAITFDDGYLDNYQTALPILQKYGFTATIFVITDFIGRSVCWPGTREVRFCSWDQLHDLTAHGIELGGHTITHPNLHEIDSAEAKHEIGESKRLLEDGLNRPVPFFAYPGGHQTAGIQQMVEAEGYAAGLGVDIGPDRLFNTWRVQITRNDSLSLFRLKVSGRFEQLKKIRHSSKLTHHLTQFAGGVINRLR